MGLILIFIAKCIILIWDCEVAKVVAELILREFNFLLMEDLEMFLEPVEL